MPRPNAIALPGVESSVTDAESQVLAVTDGCEVAELAGRQEQCDARVREPERGQTAELLAEVERELPARDDRVDHGLWTQVVVRQRGVGVGRECFGERIDLGRVDREACGGPMPAEALEMLGAGGQATVEVECTRRAARALPVPVRARDQDDRAMEALDETGRDDPDHAFVPGLVGEDVAAAALFRLRPLVDLLERLADDPVLDSLPLAVQLLELVRKLAGLVLVLGQQQLERCARAAEPSRRVDPRREPEPDGALVDSGRVDTRNFHQRPEPRLLRAREGAEAGERERAVLVDERDDVGDRRERDQVEVARQRLVAGAEQRLSELVDDARAAELGERIVGRPCGDDGAVRERLAGPVMVRDDDLEPALACLGDLLDRGHAAVDREDEPAALIGEPLKRFALDAVAFLETARQVRDDVGAELAQDEHRERGRGDAVGVVVAVDADSRAGCDRGLDRVDARGHVAEQERIVAGRRSFKERARLLGVVVAAPN